MTGEYKHSIDAKGRLSVPAKLREDLGEVCYVTLSQDPCLSIYSPESWKAFREKFDALPLSKSRALRTFFANAAKCEIDAQGRILIPQKLLDFVGLKKNVTVIGFSGHAEIWDSERYAQLEQAELTPENIAEAMQALGF